MLLMIVLMKRLSPENRLIRAFSDAEVLAQRDGPTAEELEFQLRPDTKHFV